MLSLQGTGSEPLGLDPVPLSKIGTHLLASLGIKGKNRNPLACLWYAVVVNNCFSQAHSQKLPLTRKPIPP